MDYLDGLNDQQLKAVTYNGGPLLLLAGAGSGKTRVITTRIAYLIDKLGFSPYSILAVTFTNKAAGEMRDRVLSMVGGGENVMIKTFHSFGAWMLRRNGESLGLRSSFTIYDDDDVNALLKSLIPGATRSELKQFARDISRCKDDNLTSDDNLVHINSHPEFSEIYFKYQERIKEIGNVDFGDLISLPNQLLQNNQEVRDRFQKRFKVILVDEYQDSNGAQFQLLKNLAGPDTWVCVVGDDDQSIYKFRGAEVKNILEFDKIFKGTEVIKLEENYRSTGNILAIASAVVENNINRLGKTLWTSKGAGEKPTIKYLENGEAEALYIAGLLQDVEDLDECAILYRTNAQSRQLESTLIRSNIAYKIVGTLRFYEREEIKDTLAILSFILNYRDEIAFRRIINKPARGIGKASVEKIIGIASNYDNDYMITLANSAILKGKAKKGADSFYTFIQELEALDYTVDLGHFVRKVVEDSGLLEYHRTQDANIGSGKVDNLEELINSASKYSGDTALVDFLESIELDQSSLDTEEDDNRPKVTLITMHNTKGLEFDRVFITGMENGLFPRNEKLEDLDELEEERRLFYVSITRARKHLCFTSCSRRVIHGKMMSSTPSIFLKEIPNEFVVGEEAPKAVVESGFNRGDNVYHDDYGSGYIIKVTDNGKHNLVLVKFETGQVKQFIPEFSALEKMARY
ncbi:MAG: UvrD-helicase domain-containing protein [Spirochaetaceae bacterium]